MSPGGVPFEAALTELRDYISAASARSYRTFPAKSRIEVSDLQQEGLIVLLEVCGEIPAGTPWEDFRRIFSTAFWNRMRDLARYHTQLCRDSGSEDSADDEEDPVQIPSYGYCSYEDLDSFTCSLLSQHPDQVEIASAAEIARNLLPRVSSYQRQILLDLLCPGEEVLSACSEHFPDPKRVPWMPLREVAWYHTSILGVTHQTFAESLSEIRQTVRKVVYHEDHDRANLLPGDRA